ncbi:hypothetical protein LC048_21325 [Mesobacillus subterraneus]|uniref:hypothetical protein n=1 Tax=Mesobacillus subterraneus TaxID=285983 RepID=UPI001CFE07CF|nr:hypothetical protein [Mesobacillus subterraneus]WLR54897.1 hypothetical protein LC048_21325 [Mesobacillus subterraneus]
MKRNFIWVMFVVLLVAGCSNAAVTEEEGEEIERYIRQEVMKPNFGGEILSAYEILASSEEKGEIYLWALIEEYYKEGAEVEQGSGMSVPMVLKVDRSEGALKVISHTLPRDGSFYADDVKEMFPYFAEIKALDYPSIHIKKLVKEVETEVAEKLE